MSNNIVYDYSDDEQVDDLWMEFTLKFGKLKGKKLKDVVRTRDGRNTLKYYKTWPELREDAKYAITACLNAYEESKLAQSH